MQAVADVERTLTGEQAQADAQRVLGQAQVPRPGALQARQQVPAPHHLHRHVAVQRVANEDCHREHYYH